MTRGVLITVTVVAAVSIAGCGRSESVEAEKRDAEREEKRQQKLKLVGLGVNHAKDFLAAMTAGEYDRAASLCDTPFLIGPWDTDTRIDDRLELPKRLAVARDALAEPTDYEIGNLLLASIPLHFPPVEFKREVQERWGVFGPRWHEVLGGDRWLVTFGHDHQPPPVSLLLRVRGEKHAVVGLLRIPRVSTDDILNGVPAP